MGETDEPLRLVVPNEVSEMGRVEDDVARFLQTRRVPERTAYAARVVVEEMLLNAMRHGCADGARHTIHVELRVGHDGIDIRFEDDCRAFDPRPRAVDRSAPGPSLSNRRVGGVGLQLVGAISNRFEYHRAGDKNVSAVRVSEEWGPRG